MPVNSWSERADEWSAWCTTLHSSSTRARGQSSFRVTSFVCPSIEHSWQQTWRERGQTSGANP